MTSKIKKNVKKYKLAQKIIPGGSMLYSKRAELYSPDYWPSYYEKSKGCYLWSIDGKKYIDMIFAVGTNTLGYCNKEVDREVVKAVNKGNMTSLNNVNEIQLASQLVRLHTWAHQVRFFRSGGEANSAAIRVARAFSKRKNIAFCGYHGWHDWYLSSNLNNKKNLDKHLMSNLKFSGIPTDLKNSCFPFYYNDLDGLKKIIKSRKIGSIIMEVKRNIEPKNNFLKKIRSLCNENNIVLIFDECTSGFRENLGGLHLKFKINPDIAMFGKALGNGYAINAIVGKKKIMKYFNETFVSSTFWTERIGSVAGLSTINFMRKNKTFKFIKKQGEQIKAEWKKISQELGVDIKISGLDSIPKFEFKDAHNLKRTFFTQEMLKKGYIASNIIYISIAHKNNILKQYFKYFREVFKKISMLDERKLRKLIIGRVSFSPFSRLN